MKQTRRSFLNTASLLGAALPFATVKSGAAGAAPTRLQALGFNTIQLNVAWGSRPGDEPLNLEGVVALDPEQDRQYPQVVPLRCQPGTEVRFAHLAMTKIVTTLGKSQ